MVHSSPACVDNCDDTKLSRNSFSNFFVFALLYLQRVIQTAEKSDKSRRRTVHTLSTHRVEDAQERGNEC